MAAKKPSPQFDFIVDQLKKNPNAAYGEIAAAAQKKGMKVFPIMYGRAKAMLGLVASAPRGSGKATRKKAAAKAAKAPKVAAPTGARRGRPRKVAAPAPAVGDLAGIEGIIAQVKASAAERENYRAALEKIRAILDSVL
jgi:hypothetical protein